MKTRLRKARFWVSMTAAGAATCATLGATRPANADVMAVIALMETFYTLYGITDTLASEEDKKAAERLERLRASIVADLRALRNQTLSSEVNALLMRNHEIAANPGQAGNETRLLEFMDDSIDTFAEMKDIIARNDDVESSYSLVPAVNILIPLRLEAMKNLGELNPAAAFSHEQRSFWLNEGYALNYLLIGGDFILCGRGGRVWPPGLLDSRGIRIDGTNHTYQKSQLWTQKLANVDLPMDKYWFPDAHGFDNWRTCNPGKNTCERPQPPWPLISLRPHFVPTEGMPQQLPEAELLRMASTRVYWNTWLEDGAYRIVNTGVNRMRVSGHSADLLVFEPMCEGSPDGPFGIYAAHEYD